MAPALRTMKGLFTKLKVEKRRIKQNMFEKMGVSKETNHRDPLYEVSAVQHNRIQSAVIEIEVAQNRYIRLLQLTHDAGADLTIKLQQLRGLAADGAALAGDGTSHGRGAIQAPPPSDSGLAPPLSVGGRARTPSAWSAAVASSAEAVAGKMSDMQNAMDFAVCGAGAKVYQDEVMRPLHALVAEAPEIRKVRERGRARRGRGERGG